MNEGRGVLPGPLTWTLARRLLTDSRSRLLSSSGRAALLATTLGVAALGIAMALMTGYREDLIDKLLGGNAAVLVYPAAGADGVDPIERLRAVPGVTAVAHVRYLEGVVTSAGAEAEVTLRATPATAGVFAGDGAPLGRSATGAWRVRLGRRLAEQLGVDAGSTLRLALLGVEDGTPRFAFRTLEVAGTFATGFSEFDNRWAVVDPAIVEGVPGSGLGLWEVSLARPDRAPQAAEAIRAALGDAFVAIEWQRFNRDLFAALDLQKRALFLLLGLIVLVATFNVASTLVVLVRERMRDLGVLAALGLTPRRLRVVFLAYGGVLGAAGAVLGLLIAALAATVMTRFELLSFGPEIAQVYFLESVPLRLSVGDAAVVALLAVGVTVLACLVPAWRASRLDPVVALRYE